MSWVERTCAMAVLVILAAGIVLLSAPTADRAYPAAGVLAVVAVVALIDMIAMSQIGAMMGWLAILTVLSLLSAVAAAGGFATTWRLAPAIFLVGLGIHYVLIRSGSRKVYQIFKKDAASSRDWYPHLFAKQEIMGRLAAAGIIPSGIKGRILAEIILCLKHPGASWHDRPQICFQRAKGRLAVREAEDPMFAQDYSD